MAQYTCADLPQPAFTRNTPQGVTKVLTVKPINAFGLSPSGKYICGTCVVTDGTKRYSRYIVWKRQSAVTVLTGKPTYVVEPHDTVPKGWWGLSGRAINDCRDIVGFFHRNATDQDTGQTPMKKLGEWALATPVFDYDIRGAAFGITNLREVTGQFTGNETGFTAVPSRPSHGFMIKETFPGMGLRGKNIHGDYIYVVESDGHATSFVYLAPEGRHVALGDSPIFGTAERIVVNGINDSRQVVGFFQKSMARVSQPKRTMGFFGTATVGGLALAETYVHPNDTANPSQTFLYGVSNIGTMCGTYGSVHPFILYGRR